MQLSHKPRKTYPTLHWSPSPCEREALWTREEEQIKEIYYRVAEKVRAWQKPPVVRRSAVEWPPPSWGWVTFTALDMGQGGEKPWTEVQLVREQKTFILVVLWHSFNKKKLFSALALNWLMTTLRNRISQFGDANYRPLTIFKAIWAFFLSFFLRALPASSVYLKCLKIICP